MPLTVADLRRYLDNCRSADRVVIHATLGDGSAISVLELNIGTGQGGDDGEGFEVVVDWEPGVEVITSA